MSPPRPPERLAEIDWPSWVPRARATLCFVVAGGCVLLIRKKHGLGAGKINAPGGHIEPGETPSEAAAREVREEVGIAPEALDERGLLSFQFVDGLSLFVHVFRAERHRGDARESDEAIPLWVPLDAIPYPEMWADDAVWLPRMLAGDRFEGRFLFDGDRMLDQWLRVRAG